MSAAGHLLNHYRSQRPFEGIGYGPDIERSWYTADEGAPVKRFPKFRPSLTPSAHLQRELDSDKWEPQLLAHSGVCAARHPILPTADDESESRVCLQVNTTPPDFLSHFDASRLRFSAPPTFLVDGDLSQLARAGSQSVSNWKRHRESCRPADAPCRFRDAPAPPPASHTNRTRLPVWQRRRDIVRCVAENSVVVIAGETGSGKTTQIAQFLHSEGYTRFGQIAVTQPRRVAAVSVARRVADELCTPLGDLVGYTIRFEDVSSPRTVIRFMTDGVLMREILLDAALLRYSVVIMDEAHERSLNTDVLFGVLK
jgi:hypothetical protein